MRSSLLDQPHPNGSNDAKRLIIFSPICLYASSDSPFAQTGVIREFAYISIRSSSDTSTQTFNTWRPPDSDFVVAPNINDLGIESTDFVQGQQKPVKLTDPVELRAHFATLSERCEAIGQEIIALQQSEESEGNESSILTAKLKFIKEIAINVCNGFEKLSGSTLQTEEVEERLNIVLNDVAQIEDRIRETLQQDTFLEVAGFWEDKLTVIIQQLESCVNISIAVLSSDVANDDESKDWLETAAEFIGNLERRLISCWDVCTAQISRYLCLRKF
ncbi:uncharacterized protein LOC142354854 [Convolutriloba macropyga]|uniref:uncharacterized protein LOC142354854 n=1 Tax=Convolutriloba macropyga TaxID=536237 RepID=UPI003F528A30